MDPAAMVKFGRVAREMLAEEGYAWDTPGRAVGTLELFIRETYRDGRPIRESFVAAIEEMQVCLMLGAVLGETLNEIADGHWRHSPAPIGDNPAMHFEVLLTGGVAVNPMIVIGQRIFRDGPDLIDTLQALSTRLAGSGPQTDLYPKILLETYLEGAGPVARRPWAPDHCIALVASPALHSDGVDPHRYVNQDEIGDWDTVYREALGNFLELARAKGVQHTLPDDAGRPRLIVFEGHNHLAALPLWKGFAKQVAPVLGDGFLFCLPAIDELVAFRPDQVQEIGKTCLATFRSHQHPVSPHVFIVKDGKVGIRYRVNG